VRIDGDRLFFGNELVAERPPQMSRREGDAALSRYAIRELKLHPNIELREAYRRARAALPAARDAYDNTGG